MNIADAAWLAGVLDGEGSLTTKRATEKDLEFVPKLKELKKYA